MTLAMTRPWKHPKTGIFWLRKRVPKDLLSVVGRLEEKRSLATRDPVEAKRRLAEALLEVEARWADLRSAPGTTAPLTISGSTSLSELEAHEIARVFYDRYLEVYSGNPSEGFWKPEIGQTLWRKVDMDLLWNSPEWRLSYDRQRGAEAWVRRRSARHRGASRPAIGRSRVGSSQSCDRGSRPVGEFEIATAAPGASTRRFLPPTTKFETPPTCNARVERGSVFRQAVRRLASGEVAEREDVLRLEARHGSAQRSPRPY